MPDILARITTDPEQCRSALASAARARPAFAYATDLAGSDWIQSIWNADLHPLGSLRTQHGQFADGEDNAGLTGAPFRFEFDRHPVQREESDRRARRSQRSFQ